VVVESLSPPTATSLPPARLQISIRQARQRQVQLVVSDDLSLLLYPDAHILFDGSSLPPLLFVPSSLYPLRWGLMSAIVCSRFRTDLLRNGDGSFGY